MESSIFVGKFDQYFPPAKPPIAVPARPEFSDDPVQRVIYVTRRGLAVVAYVNHRKGTESRHV